MKTENTPPNDHRKSLAALRQTLGDNIRCFREKFKWSQKKLASEAGLHKDYLGKVERGRVTIGVDNLHKIAVLFKINTAWLLIKDYCFSLQKFFKKGEENFGESAGESE